MWTSQSLSGSFTLLKLTCATVSLRMFVNERVLTITKGVVFDSGTGAAVTIIEDDFIIKIFYKELT